MKFKSKGQLVIFIIVVLVVVTSTGLIIDNKVNNENSIISKITTSSKKDKENKDAQYNEYISKNDESKNSQDGENSSENSNNTSNGKDSNSKDSNNVSSNPRGEEGSYNFNPSKKDRKVNSEKLPYKLPDKQKISVQKVGQYSGQFLENGKDEEVEDVFAVIVKNNSKQMLQYAQLQFKIDGEEANFLITNLPPGKTTLALESNKKSFSKTKDISYVGASTSYMDSYSMNKDKFKVTSEGTKLTLKNLTNKKYSTVYIYYKNVDDNGSYLGGITYRTKFENVKANDSITTDTEHYLKGASEIVMVDYIE